MPPTPPKKPFNLGRLSKGLSFWILVILIPVAIIQFSGARGEPAAQIEYWQYRAELEKNNIVSATVHGGRSVEGEFRQV